MKKAFYLGGNLLAGAPDMMTGTLTAVVVALLMNHPLSPLAAVLAACAWGAFWLVSPDMDIVPPILRRGFTGKSFNFDHHQTWLHWPVVMLPLVAVCTWFLFGPYWCVVAVLNLFLHYVHDAVFMKDGLIWLLRFKRKYQATYWQKNAPKTPDEWVEKNWLQPSWLSLSELLVGTMCSSTSVVLIANDVLLGILALVWQWVAVALFWFFTFKAEEA